MTAEAVIMNKHAVAMAADSAVTIGGAKVFNSANKIFAASKYHPVGLMVFGNAEFMGIPWETIVKLYRRQLGQRSFARLGDYADQFVAFLQRLVGAGLVEEGEDELLLATSAYSFFAKLKRQIESALERAIQNGSGCLGEGEIEQLVLAKIAEANRQCEEAPLLGPVSRSAHAEAKRVYRDQIAQIASDVFEQLPITPTAHGQLHEMAISLHTRDWIENPYASGVVVAGYGDDDIFPRLRECRFIGALAGHLCYERRREINIGAKCTAAITPFAQGEMVTRFMEAVDRDYEEHLQCALAEHWAEAIEGIMQQLAVAHVKDAENIRDAVAGTSQEMLNRFWQQQEDYRHSSYVMPILNVVKSMPKDELAELAESLVNLTSLKRRMSQERETVGGPVDVAIISRGDGLIWARRKHYFRAELNPQFFANYYRREANGNGEHHADGADVQVDG